MVHFKGTKDKDADLQFYAVIGSILWLVLLIQHKVFNEHSFLIIGLLIFVIIFSAFIYWILSKDDVYIIECTMQGEQFKNLQLVEKEIATTTSMRILKMDKEIYDMKNHVGDAKNPFWNITNRIKLCDYFDGETFYHPEFTQLHNISFYSAKSFWLKMKQDLPDLIRQNVVLTWLSEYKIAFHQNTMKQNFALHLKSINEQHEHEPFSLHDDLNKFFDELYKDKLKSMSIKEELSKTMEESKDE